MADVELLPLPEWTKRDDLGGLVPSEVRAEMQAYARANVEHATAAQAAEIEALRAEAETWHYNWNRFVEPITSYFVYKPGFVIRPESAREDEGGPYASHPCGAAKNIICYVDALEARAERLAEALRRYGVHDETCTAMDIPICTCGLDAALEQENGDA